MQVSELSFNPQIQKKKIFHRFIKEPQTERYISFISSVPLGLGNVLQNSSWEQNSEIDIPSCLPSDLDWLTSSVCHAGKHDVLFLNTYVDVNKMK